MKKLAEIEPIKFFSKFKDKRQGQEIIDLKQVCVNCPFRHDCITALVAKFYPLKTPNP